MIQLTLIFLADKFWHVHLEDIVAHFPQIKIKFLPNNMENGTSIWSSFGCSHENVYANNLLNNSPLLLTQQVMVCIRIR